MMETRKERNIFMERTQRMRRVNPFLKKPATRGRNTGG